MSENREQLLEHIRNLVPINELALQYQEQIANHAQVIKCRKSRYIFKQGDQDNFSFYLLDGEIELLADGQLHNVIVSGSDRARYAMAQLQPRQFSAKAKTAVTILQIDRNALDHMLVLAEKDSADNSGSGMDVEVGEVEFNEIDDDSGDWMTRMLHSELFSRMPTANIHQLFAHLEPVEMKAGDVVIKQGDPGDKYYIIQEGRCSVTRKPAPEATEIKLAELREGDNFGEEALISEATRNATVTMDTDGILMQLSKDSFIELIKKPTLKSVSYEQAESLVSEGAIWLDLRFQNEYKESNIEGSINIPLNMLRAQMKNLDKNKKYVVYCDTSGRSSTGTFLLAENGFDACYLDGGLIKVPQAARQIKEENQENKEPVTETSKKTAESKPEIPVSQPVPVTEDSVDAEVRVKIIEAELERTNTDIRRSEEHRQALDSAMAEAEEAAREKLLEERAKLEAEMKAAEAEVKRKAQDEAEKLERLKQKAKKSLQEEKKQLESIYSKNTEEMEKLQRMRQETEQQIKNAREQLEKEAEEAKRKLEEARQLKKEIEASKRNMEKEALKKQKEQEEMEKQAQIKAKAKLEEERRKLAEQYERNSKEFEKLQQEKIAAEAARLAAKEEAEKLINEYKQQHERTRAEEEKKLHEERLKLEEEAKKIQETLLEIKRAKREAEEARKAAQEEAEKLKVKHEDTSAPEEIRDIVKVELEAVEVKLEQAKRNLEDAQHAEKVAESAKEENEQDLARKRQQEEELLAQLKADVADFEDELEMQAKSVSQIQTQQEHMKQIMERAKAAQKAAKEADEDLLADISKQLGKEE